MNSKCDLFKKVQCINESLITGFILYSLCKLLTLFDFVTYTYRGKKRLNKER